MESSIAIACLVRQILRLLVVGVIVAAALTFVGTASAAWPGANGRIFFLTFDSWVGADTIFSINADGSDVRQIYWNGTQYSRRIEISPDGSRLVANIGSFSPEGYCSAGSAGGFGCPLAIISADGTRLGGYGAGGWDPTISAACRFGHNAGPDYCYVQQAMWLDDTHLVFNEVDGTLGTTALNFDVSSGVATPFADPFPPDLGRSPISPDGRKKVYMAADADGVQQVFVANGDGSSPVKLTSILAAGTQCSPVLPICAHGLMEVVWQSLPDPTPPVITPHVGGTQGDGGWYTSDVTVTWSVEDPESNIASSTGCDPANVTTDTASLDLGCTAKNRWGTSASQSVVVKRDATDPTVSYIGNAGTYTLTNTVAITCTAADNLSGVASSTCSDINRPAYLFAPGLNSFSASATDNAGNVGTGSTSFTVLVTPAGLCALTHQLVDDSTKYQTLTRAQKVAVDTRVKMDCSILNQILPRQNATLKAAYVRAYDAEITQLENAGLLTHAQSTRLQKLAANL